MKSCIIVKRNWATSNKLKLNDNKQYEFMLVISKNLYDLPTSITVGIVQIIFKQSVKNLGFILDSNFMEKTLSMLFLEHTTSNYII